MVTVLFDGDCGLCNRTVRFVVKRDKRNQFRFLPQASPEGVELLEMAKMRDIDAIVVVADGQFLVESDAVIAILSRLGFPWNLFRFSKWVPQKFRDFLYRRIARNRLAWFGQSDSCELPAYFLDSRKDD